MNKLLKPENIDAMSNPDKLKITLNEPCNVKYTAQFLIDILDHRPLLNNVYYILFLIYNYLHCVATYSL